MATEIQKLRNEVKNLKVKLQFEAKNNTVLLRNLNRLRGNYINAVGGSSGPRSVIQSQQNKNELRQSGQNNREERKVGPRREHRSRQHLEGDGDGSIYETQNNEESIYINKVNEMQIKMSRFEQ